MEKRNLGLALKEVNKTAVKGMALTRGDTVPRKSTKEKSQELEESDNEGWLSVIVTQDLNYFVIKTKGFFGSWFWKV